MQLLTDNRTQLEALDAGPVEGGLLGRGADPAVTGLKAAADRGRLTDPSIGFQAAGFATHPNGWPAAMPAWGDSQSDSPVQHLHGDSARLSPCRRRVLVRVSVQKRATIFLLVLVSAVLRHESWGRSDSSSAPTTPRRVRKPRSSCKPTRSSSRSACSTRRLASADSSSRAKASTCSLTNWAPRRCEPLASSSIQRPPIPSTRAKLSSHGGRRQRLADVCRQAIGGGRSIWSEPATPARISMASASSTRFGNRSRT